MSRWAPAPALNRDKNDPLLREFQAIPATGTGLDLTSRQLALLARATPAERHVRASKMYSKLGLPFHRFRPDRPNLNINYEFDRIADADFRHCGITRAQLPRFASGGKKSVITGSIDEEGYTEDIPVLWSQALDTPRFRNHIATVESDHKLPFIVQPGFQLGTMSVKVKGVLGYKNFVETVKDTVESSQEVEDLNNSLENASAHPHKVAFYYREPGNPTLRTFVIQPKRVNDSLKRAIGIMRRLQVDRYYVQVGMGLRR
ncbi:hypothetical protein IFR05_002391 [Cadophora sp. M221]|nr:hypothetical protein IFR05_002391 [Cadophora sp. M221]